MRFRFQFLLEILTEYLENFVKSIKLSLYDLDLENIIYKNSFT
jgi:hypothetical protein